MTSQLKKLQETMEQKTKIEIGDVIRVRGYVREFRKEREICATLYYKVDDPVWNIQIARMLELPALYKRIYDQPFRNPALKEEEALKVVCYHARYEETLVSSEATFVWSHDGCSELERCKDSWSECPVGSFGRVSFGKSLEKKSVPVWCDYDAVFVFLCKPFLPSIMNQLVELHCLGASPFLANPET
ncbi:CST complex subunit STN1 [Cricetulus griseus]|uniref:CST complex subunit STN1 n=1 Tax=Cricetulus griseus TaxID=10029 RepID=A0A061IDP5_CRIGR|nr:CST complex subunit STN1 [Cricetulus griseus]